jgi:membrane glycosyltransferase
MSSPNTCGKGCHQGLYKTFRAFKKANPNKAGHVWHHIVEQRMVKRMEGKVPISVNLTGHFGFNLTDLSERKRRWTL